MKIQIRRSVFETNSSSTHSICISKAPAEIKNDASVYFRIGEYGWETDTEYDVSSYLYTAILMFDDYEELLTKLKSILDKNNISYEFEEPEFSHTNYNGVKHSYLENGYIDHYEETREFVNTVLSNEDMLMRMMFGDSVVYTGNDNCDSEPDRKDIADETYYDEDVGGYVTNPYHDPEHYDYFSKGN